ncbi:hypothetical protein FDP41_001805 [Naegleria fowleri]|uniref:Cytidyltransferase-like domain-containing protein n=1 Tax=Naegleria fowleri TaxID=5763 RepID=A0A6A5BXW6_NAEFO|nr:uncharacterized protein FDP41_001805 [Naegleria fowleri]KAF0979462.1 hypothetical protein FDP41_001805 [Naegleria fowleri]
MINSSEAITSSRSDDTSRARSVTHPPPQFHILWFDKSFSHLSETISKFHNVLFNTLVQKCHLDELINHLTHLQSPNDFIQYLKNICRHIGILKEQVQNFEISNQDNDRFIQISKDDQATSDDSTDNSLFLNHEDHHLLIITSLGGKEKQGLTILESVKQLKQKYPKSKIFSAVYSQTAMQNIVLQNTCFQLYQADFVSSLGEHWNFPNIEQPNPLMALECFVAKLYQESYYPKLLNFIHTQVLKVSPVTISQINSEIGNSHCKLTNFSPSSPLVKPFMKLVAEEEREQLKKEQKEYDTTYEWIPLRKIAHNLHCRLSTQASNFSHKSPSVIQHHPAYVVLIATGGLNPPHKMHLQMLRQAQDYAENYYELRMQSLCSKKLNKDLYEKQLRPIEVVGGFMSPSHDKYIHSKMAKYDYSKDGQKAYNANERLLLCELASQEDPFVSSYPWESMQSTFVSFSQVANCLSEFLRSSECPLSILIPQHPQTRTLQDSKSYLRVAFVMGADLILRASARRFNYVDHDMMTFVIGRSGADAQQVLNALQNTHSNLPVYYVDPDIVHSLNASLLTQLSSTEVRKLLKVLRQDPNAHDLKNINTWSRASKDAYERLSQVLDERVLNYIITYLN